jgi:hypothetical protein
VDDVERITGYDFFPALPDSIENEVEGTIRDRCLSHNDGRWMMGDV